MTRAELIAAARSYLSRPTMPSDDVALLLGIAHGEIDRILRKHPRAHVIRPYLVPADHDNIPLPEDAGHLNRLYGPDMKPMERLKHLAELQTCTGWVDGGNCLFVGVSSTSRQMYLDYQRHLAPLTADSSTNWVSDHFPDLYLYGALKESAVYLKDDPRLAGWEQQFNRRVREVRLDGWDSNLGAAPRVR